MTASPPTSVIDIDGIPMIPDARWQWDESSKETSPIGYDQMLIKGNTVIFHPEFSFGTAAARAEKPMTRTTVAYWEITVPHRMFGTSLMFGIGTRSARTHLPITFNDLLGEDDHSVGLNHHGNFYFGGEHFCLSSSLSAGKIYGATIGMLFNGPDASLTYFCDGTKLGTITPKLDLSRVYYPMVASTAQQSQFTITAQYVGLPTCRTLYQTSLQRVASMLTSDDDVTNLPLPRSLKGALYSQLRLFRLHNQYDLDLEFECNL